MEKEDQIRAVAMAIQELSNLIIILATEPEYTMEQAATYYKTIVEMHDIIPRKEEDDKTLIDCKVCDDSNGIGRKKPLSLSNAEKLECGGWTGYF